MTDYRILKASDENTRYTLLGSIRAASPKQALRLWHDLHPVEAGEYVAVPERNWTLLRPELVTETRLVFK